MLLPAFACSLALLLLVHGDHSSLHRFYVVVCVWLSANNPSTVGTFSLLEQQFTVSEVSFCCSGVSVLQSSEQFAFTVFLCGMLDSFQFLKWNDHTVRDRICNFIFKWAGGGSPSINWDGDFAPTLTLPQVVYQP